MIIIDRCGTVLCKWVIHLKCWKVQNVAIPLETNDNIKGIPQWSGRVRHKKVFFSESYIFL